MFDSTFTGKGARQADFQPATATSSGKHTDPTRWDRPTRSDIGYGMASIAGPRHRRFAIVAHESGN